MSGGGEALTEPEPGVEQILVNGVAVGVELEGQHIDRHVVQGYAQVVNRLSP